MISGSNYYDKINLYNKGKPLSGIVQYKGCYYPLPLVQEIYEAIHIPFKSLLLYGPPGGGKTHIARNIISALQHKIHGEEVKTFYTNLGDFTSNVTDFKYYPTLKDNNMFYVKSELVKLNEASLAGDFIVNNIFDEVSRITNEAQNQLLAVTEDNESRSFLLGHLGESIPIKRENLVVLCMNPDGAGTTEMNEALLDRVLLIHVPVPGFHMFRKIFSDASEMDQKDVKSLNALSPVENRSLNEYHRDRVIRFFSAFTPSIRFFKEIFWYIRHSPFPKERLVGFLQRRSELGLIDLGRISVEELEESMIPELMHDLEF